MSPFQPDLSPFEPENVPLLARMSPPDPDVKPSIEDIELRSPKTFRALNTPGYYERAANTANQTPPKTKQRLGPVRNES